VDEVVAREEARLVHVLGQRVREAIAEVQPRRMPGPSPEVSMGSAIVATSE
jgi:hypothetical protein